MQTALAALALGGSALIAAGCGRDAAPQEPPPAERAEQTATATPAPRAAGRRPFRPVRCPSAMANCRAVTGRVIYVEAVDPDGDGDAHYVLAGGSVTAPGITAVDVKPALRPRRLPRPGERVSAAGPVFTGSYGQRQIEAIAVRHDR